jgi:hypothetical protein
MAAPPHAAAASHHPGSYDPDGSNTGLSYVSPFSFQPTGPLRPPVSLCIPPGSSSAVNSRKRPLREQMDPSPPLPSSTTTAPNHGLSIDDSLCNDTIPARPGISSRLHVPILSPTPRSPSLSDEHRHQHHHRPHAGTRSNACRRTSHSPTITIS